MRVHARTGRNTGVSLGPAGTLIVLPFLAVYTLGYLTLILAAAAFEAAKAAARLAVWAAATLRR